MSARKGPAVLRIIGAHDGALLGTVRGIFREYGLALDDRTQISLLHQDLDRELDVLPGRYALPQGRILLALDSNVPGWNGAPPSDAAVAGCIALRPLEHLGHGVCEMKRMYVRPAWRGRGVGRMLGERLIADAAAIGYGVMKLDTSPTMDAAIGLYRSIGFTPCARYNDDPVEETLYFERRLP